MAAWLYAATNSSAAVYYRIHKAVSLEVPATNSSAASRAGLYRLYRQKSSPAPTVARTLRVLPVRHGVHGVGG
jgi:hypothetical protein